MIIIHEVNDLQRLLSPALARAAKAMPAVVVTGARQTGKTTLVQAASGDDRAYLTLDDVDVLGQARDEPEALVSRAPRLTLDEVQRAPELLLAVKRAVDRDRRKGRFFLTGSANLLLMRNVSESLAGRAAYLTLWPMTRREQQGSGRAGTWSDIIAAADADWRDLVKSAPGAGEDWTSFARRGGYPVPAVHMTSDADRNVWFTGFTRTYLERDLQELSAIGSLPDFRRVMRAVCLRIGQLVNQTELGRDVGIPQPTVNRWLNLLETSYQLVRLPAYAVNRTKRLIKAPKMYWSDTGLALHLSGQEQPGGAHLENLILCDLLAWRDAQLDAAELFYWRTASGAEVDFVIETGGRLLPVEVKSTERPRTDDVHNLRLFREEYGRRSRAGLLLHAGDSSEWISPGILAAPWWKVI